jgi:hypothetical protein
MIDFGATKNTLKNKLIEDLKIMYKKEIDEAKDVSYTFLEIFKQTNSEYLKVQSSYVKSNSDVKLTIPINNLIQSIEDLLARKKKETYNTAFEFFTKGFIQKEQKEIIEKIAKVEAYKKQIDFLIAEEQKLFTQEALISAIIKNEIELPINHFPLIFKNRDSYEMFLELKSLSVKEKTTVADYSFIFHQMKDKSIKAINSNVTEPMFIEFLNLNFKTNIDVRKLPFRKPEYKKQLYSVVFNKFKDRI